MKWTKALPNTEGWWFYAVSARAWKWTFVVIGRDGEALVLGKNKMILARELSEWWCRLELPDIPEEAAT